MPRKKKTEETVIDDTTGETGPAPAQEEAMVTILRTGQAPKLSPRGDGQLTYQIGRMDDTVLLRISGNESSGRFSREWVTVEAIRKSLAQLPKGVKSFKGAVALKSAWKGRSSCNSGFGAAILKAEGVFVADEDPKKKSMLQAASADALEKLEQSVRAMKVPNNAETVPLNPPKPKPFFAKKSKGDGDATVVEPVDQVGQVDDADDGESPPEGDDS